jgi:hypothetical protein
LIGKSDAFVTTLNGTGSALTFSTYLGGNGGDDALGIAVDAAGNTFVAGISGSTNFPTTAGAYQTAWNGNSTGEGFVAEISLAPSFSVAGFPSSVTAGVAGNVTITAQNADGSINTGYTGAVHFTSSDPQAVLPPDYTFTAADNGVHTFSATLKTAGSQAISAADTSIASMAGTQSGIVVTASAATHFVLSGPASVAANTAFSITATAVDAYGNVATGYTGTVHFTDSATGATLPANYTFKASDGGTHTFSGLKLKTKGWQTITVADTVTVSTIGSWLIDVT